MSDYKLGSFKIKADGNEPLIGRPIPVFEGGTITNTHWNNVDQVKKMAWPTCSGCSYEKEKERFSILFGY